MRGTVLMEMNMAAAGSQLYVLMLKTVFGGRWQISGLVIFKRRERERNVIPTPLFICGPEL